MQDPGQRARNRMRRVRERGGGEGDMTFHASIDRAIDFGARFVRRRGRGTK